MARWVPIGLTCNLRMADERIAALREVDLSRLDADGLELHDVRLGDAVIERHAVLAALEHIPDRIALIEAQQEYPSTKATQTLAEDALELLRFELAAFETYRAEIGGRDAS